MVKKRGNKKHLWDKRKTPEKSEDLLKGLEEEQINPCFQTNISYFDSNSVNKDEEVRYCASNGSGAKKT